MKFTEAQLENAFIELLEQEGYPHTLGGTLDRNPDEVLIEEDLLSYLLVKYQHEFLTESEARSILMQIKSLPASDLYESNKRFMSWLSDGFILKREDPNQKDIHIELLDYAGLEYHQMKEGLEVLSVADKVEKYENDRNIYRFVNQLEITGTEKRIPDGIIYINGLPLVVFEFKSAIREEASLFDAFKQITKRYKRDIPELFKYNAFCVLSDGANNKAGSFFCTLRIFLCLAKSFWNGKGSGWNR